MEILRREKLTYTLEHLVAPAVGAIQVSVMGGVGQNEYAHVGSARGIVLDSRKRFALRGRLFHGRWTLRSAVATGIHHIHDTTCAFGYISSERSSADG